MSGSEYREWEKRVHKEREIGALEDIAEAQKKAARARRKRTQPPLGTPRSTEEGEGRGCGGLAGIGCGGLIILALVVAFFQRLGCISSEDALRAGTSVVLTGREIDKEKKLLWVNFKVENRTKWPVSGQLTFAVGKTTEAKVITTNSIDLKRIAPRSKSKELRVAFDLEEIRRCGISDPADPDICRVTHSFTSIDEAD